MAASTSTPVVMMTPSMSPMARALAGMSIFTPSSASSSAASASSVQQLLAPQCGSFLPIVLTIKTRERGNRLEYAQVTTRGSSASGSSMVEEEDDDEDDSIKDEEELLTIAAGARRMTASTLWTSTSSKMQVRVAQWGAEACTWCWVGQELQFSLVDLESEVAEVEMTPFMASEHETAAPNLASPFKIQNACGTWSYPDDRDLRATMVPVTMSVALRKKLVPIVEAVSRSTGKKVRRTKKQIMLAAFCGGRSPYDGVHTLSGTFVISRTKRRVDFKGVRSFRLMLNDWLHILGNPSRGLIETVECMTCTIYMVLLKGNIGYTLALQSEINYVIENTYGAWQSAQVRSMKEMRVCDVLELRDIEWGHPLWSGEVFDHTTIKQGKTTVEISRKGGSVIRCIFPKDTAWNEHAEADVLASCSALWYGLRQVLGGYYYPCPSSSSASLSLSAC